MEKIERVVLICFLMTLLAGSVVAEDIVYVVKNNRDSVLINLVNETRYSYKIIENHEIPTTDFSKYKMILIGDDGVKDVPVNSYRSLIVNPDYYEGWSGGRGSIAGNNPLKAITIDATHTITNGILQEFQVYTKARFNGISIPLYYLSGKKYSVYGIVSTLNDRTKFVIATKDNPRRVFFGITKTEYWTDNTKRLFKNSIEWLMDGDVVGAPILSPIGNKIVNKDSLLKFNVYATDEENDVLFFSIENNPTSASFVDNGDGTASFSWTPNVFGSYKVKFIVRDSSGLTDSEEIMITVNNVEELPEFGDADACEKINENIKVKINEPDDGDDFEIGDEISGEIEIENDEDKDLDFNVQIHLYDIDEDKSMKQFESSVKIDEGDEEIIEFTLEVPSDADEEDENVIFVVAEDGKNYCNQDYIEIEIERGEKVVIEDIEINPVLVSPGGNIEVKVSVKNVGDEDEDVSVKVEVEDLGISKESEKFELEKYDDDDEKTSIFNLKIPENAEEKDYEIEVSVSFNGEQDSKTESFSVMGKTTTPVRTAGTIKLDESKLQIQEKTNAEVAKGLTQNQILIIVDIFLIIGIIVEIILIKLALR